MSRFLIMVLAGIFSATGANAQLVVADVEGRVEITTGNFIAAGSLGRAVFTIKNNGPGEIPEPTGGTNYVPNVGFRTIELVATPETPPCVVQYADFIAPPGQLSRIVASVRPLQPIAAGASIQCIVGIFVYPEAPSELRLRFGFRGGTEDLNPDNDTVFVTIRTRVVDTVPTLSSWSLLALLLSIVGIAWQAGKKS